MLRELKEIGVWVFILGLFLLVCTASSCVATSADLAKIEDKLAEINADGTVTDVEIADAKKTIQEVQQTVEERAKAIADGAVNWKQGLIGLAITAAGGFAATNKYRNMTRATDPRVSNAAKA